MNDCMADHDVLAEWGNEFCFYCGVEIENGKDTSI